MWSDENEQRDNYFTGGNWNGEILLDIPISSPDRWEELLNNMHNTNASPQMPVMLTISGDDDPSSLSQVERFYQCGETSTMSGHKKKRQEKETLSEVQPTEMQNNNPEGQATVETIVRNNIPISVTKMQPGLYPNLDSIMVQDSSNGQHLLLDSLKTFEKQNFDRPSWWLSPISGDDNPQCISQVELFYPCGETSTMPSHKRKRQEKETLFEGQPTEMQNNNPEGQATVETIVGNNIPISVTGGELLIHHAVDHPAHVVAQPSLEPISTQTSNSVSSTEGAKLIYNELIALPLKDLINPENETYMKNALYTLANNHSLFSEEQADQILELYVEFPALVHKWREYSQFPMYSQMSSAEMEKISDLVKNSERDEEILEARYEELENEEKELMRQLEAVQKEKAETAEQRIQKYKEDNLNKLADQWAELQSFFV